MELNGVRYLDANDYYRIVITEEEQAIAAKVIEQITLQME